MNSHYFLFILIVYFNSEVSGISSPCPEVFSYHNDGVKNFGLITLPSRGRQRTTVIVRLTINDNLNTANSGTLQLQNSLETLLATLDKGELLQYKVTFPVSENIPVVRSITLNKQEYCSNPAERITDRQSTIQVVHSFYPDSHVPDYDKDPIPIPNGEKDATSIVTNFTSITTHIKTTTNHTSTTIIKN